jgi:hypothetical protein
MLLATDSFLRPEFLLDDSCVEYSGGLRVLLHLGRQLLLVLAQGACIEERCLTVDAVAIHRCGRVRVHHAALASGLLR